MSRMTVGEALDAFRVLQHAGRQSTGSIDGTIKVAKAISPALKELESVASAFEIEREALVTKHAARDDEGNVIPADEKGQIRLADPDAWRADYDALMGEVKEIESRVDSKGLASLSLTALDLVPILDLLD